MEIQHVLILADTSNSTKLFVMSETKLSHLVYLKTPNLPNGKELGIGVKITSKEQLSVGDVVFVKVTNCFGKVSSMGNEGCFIDRKYYVCDVCKLTKIIAMINPETYLLPTISNTELMNYVEKVNKGESPTCFVRVEDPLQYNNTIYAGISLKPVVLENTMLCRID